MRQDTANAVGVDISKSHLDAHRLRTGETARFGNDAAGFKELAGWIGAAGRVVYAATGRYHRDFEVALVKAGLPLTRANPLRARRFAQSMGRNAKTDAVGGARPATDGAAGRGAARPGGLDGHASRVPHPVWVLLLCAVFTAVGVAVLDDYGVSWDEFQQRDIALETISYVLGQDDELLSNQDKFYGTAFEMPLLIVERVLGLQDDTRALLLSRHILSHLFFIAGGFFCYLLTRRLFGSTVIALFAMLLFLLHPRLYAESFVNTKDMPLAAMFMVALFLTHRAFRKDAVGAFLLCGLAVGVLVNIRVLGVVLFAAVPAARALDWLFASGERGGKHALVTGGVFVLAAMFALYATLPYLWANPVERAVEMFATLSHYPTVFPQLFQGELTIGDDLPPRYIPTWIAITTPPVALLLGVAGTVAVLRRGWAGPRDILRHADLKFGFLLIGCLLATWAAVVVFTPSMYNGWRQTYFLYAPFCVLAAFGLRWLAAVPARAVVRGAVYGLVGAGVLLVVPQMVRIHPYQQAYFNFLVDRETPGRLGDQYPVEYWGTSYLDGLRWLTATYPDSLIQVRAINNHDYRNRAFLPATDRQRIALTGEGEAIPDFYMTNHFNNDFNRREVAVFAPIVHRREVYNNPVLSVAALDLSAADGATADAYRQIYRDAVTGSPVVSGGGFDVYYDEPEETLTYVNESCEPEDVANRFMLSIAPFDANDLPAYLKQRGRSRSTPYFNFGEKGVKFDGKCLMVFQLPEYRIYQISMGYRDTMGYRLGEKHFWGTFTELRYVERTIEAAGEPVIRTKFDVYLWENLLLYSKEPCAPADISDKFFLHLIAADRDDLPENRQKHEFDNLDFNFDQAGGIAGGKCVARIFLPDYPITGIRTGQYIPDSGQVWKAEFPVGSR